MTSGSTTRPRRRGDGVAEVLAQEGRADVYTIDGVRLKADVPEGEALDGLRKGTYIVNGKKNRQGLGLRPGRL